jgi:ABC-type transport system involved in multi-copper enzyme maturation permease subunit
MTAAVTSYRSDLPPARAGFAQLVRAEWTKFRTVRGWMIALLAGASVTVLIGLLSAVSSHTSCSGPGGAACSSSVPVGPDGNAVTDVFQFVHQPLEADGSLTARVTSLVIRTPSGAGASPGAAVQPWAKAGLILRPSLVPGSPYVAIMTTGGHGVRMQADFVHDTAGRPGAVSSSSPRWLRLTRSGSMVIGYESVDGRTWTEVDRRQLPGGPSTVQVGMFVTSPELSITEQHLGGTSSIGGPTEATAAFDQVSLQEQSPGKRWSVSPVDGETGTATGTLPSSNSRFTITGAGDIAPAVAGPAPNTVERSLVGAFAGLIVMIVLGTVFITAEYRHGLIRTTLTVSPRRGRVLLAKAVVLGSVIFVAGLLASTVGFWLVGLIRRNHGEVVLPVNGPTELRVVVGTAALLAVSAVLALAVGSILRRSVGAVAVVVVAVVLPYILAIASVLPTSVAQRLLRVTPAAGFAIQQSIPQYSQVAATYSPATGYFPLTPTAGFGVLCAWTALALGLAVVLLRRRDA